MEDVVSDNGTFVCIGL